MNNRLLTYGAQVEIVALRAISRSWEENQPKDENYVPPRPWPHYSAIRDEDRLPGTPRHIRLED